MKIIDLDQRSEKWLMWRRSGIGSTAISAIMGLNPYKNVQSVYEELLGLSETFVNEAMKNGMKYEDEARELINLQYNFKPMCIQSDACSYFIASLDGYDKNEDMILEIKIPTAKNYLSFNAIPPHYMCQVQWQLMCTGAKKALFMVYSPQLEAYKLTEVEREEKFIESMKKEAHKFWVNFQNGDAPIDKNKTIDLSLDIEEEKVTSLKQYAEMIKWLEKAYELTKDELLKIGLEKSNNQSFCCHGIRVIKNEGRTSYDYKSMEEDGINLDKYKKQGKESFTVKLN